MKKPKKTYVGAAVFFERVADDGWPEDAGLWSVDVGGCRLHTNSVTHPKECVRQVRRLSLSSFIQSILRSRNRR